MCSSTVSPQLFFFVRGRRIRALTATGFAASEAYSNNAVAVLADYLTSSIYGPGFSDSDLDAASWYKAYQIAGAAVQGPESVASAQLAKTLPDILGRAFPGLTDFESLYRNLGIFGYSGLPAGALESVWRE